MASCSSPASSSSSNDFEIGSNDVSQWVQQNPISPAVAQQKLQTLVNERNGYLDDLAQLRDRLNKLNIKPEEIPPGTAEIGILIPRDLFHNHLDELIKELGVLNHVLRAVSEVATGTVQQVEVRQISTSDPSFFFGLDPLTTAMLGGLVAWALKQWKTVEEIRKLRSETQKNQSFSPNEIKSFFDSKIEQTITDAINHKVTELLGVPEKDASRKNEKRTELAWVLKSILARIERGMTVEIRFLPPAAPAAGDDKQKQKEAEAYSTMKEISPQLVFPPADKAPVLELPPPEPEKAAASPKTPKPQ